MNQVLGGRTVRTGPSAIQEQLGYALHLPLMIWYGVLGWRQFRANRTAPA